MAVDSTPAAAGDDSVKRLLPWLVAVAFFMEALDITILNTAVPAIAAALNVAPLSMKAVLSSYTLSVAVFIPISGWLADRYGTRRVFFRRHRRVHRRLIAASRVGPFHVTDLAEYCSRKEAVFGLRPTFFPVKPRF
jgi:hypothetical protein